MVSEGSSFYAHMLPWMEYFTYEFTVKIKET